MSCIRVIYMTHGGELTFYHMKKRKEKSLLAVVGVLFFSSFVSTEDTYSLPNPKAYGLSASSKIVLLPHNTPTHNHLGKKGVNTYTSSIKKNSTLKRLTVEFLNSGINFSPIFNFNNCTVMQNIGIINFQPYCL